MGLDPSSPEMTFLLAMLHTGTMFAVIVYFWPSWREHYLASAAVFWQTAKAVVIATLATGLVGFGLKLMIEKVFLGGGDIELLFSQLRLMAGALVAAGLLIIWSGRREREPQADREITLRSAGIVGLVQGLCIPFRGLSRSGATISAGLLLGIGKLRIEAFSFALAVVLTPPVVGRMVWRLLNVHPEVKQPAHLIALLKPGLLGMGFSFAGGLLALWLLSRLLASGRWRHFGYYCLVFAAFVFSISFTT